MIRRAISRRAASSRSCTRILGLILLAAQAAPEAAAEPTPVMVAGDAPRNGIFDPSVEYASGAAEGWLAYSAVFGDLDPFGPHVETHMARSVDGGATWSFVAVVNSSTYAGLALPGGESLPGVWNYEVPSLVHDPGDSGAEWKLFNHRIFRQIEDNFTTEQNLPAYSWITLRTAPDPSGPWSAEIALLASGVFPPAPYDVVETAINDLDPSLADLIVYSEPGAFERDGVLYLSLSGLTSSGPDRIVLLASDDHAASWRYVGTPLSNADAPALGFLSFRGSAIAEDDGRVFLLVTPESPGVLHDGTLAIEFDQLVDGTLVRDAGVLQVHLALPPQPGLPANWRGGQADYHEGNTAGGLLQPALHFELAPQIFQFSSTGVHLLSATGVPALGMFARGGLILGLGLLGARATRRRGRRAPRQWLAPPSPSPPRGRRSSERPSGPGARRGPKGRIARPRGPTAVVPLESRVPCRPEPRPKARR